MDLKADRETIGFKNFPIREFVASVHEKDPEKCWPFASLCAYKDFAESISLVSLNSSEDGEAPKLSEGEISKGKEAGSDSRTGFELEIPNGNETGSDTATGFELEKGEGIAYITARARELEVSKRNNNGFETAAEKADIEDDSDDDTLGLFLKKRKGIKVSRHARNQKKQKRLQVGKPRPVAVKRPNHGPEGSRTMTKKSKSADTPDYFATETLAEALRSVELETAMAKGEGSKTPVAGAPSGARGLLVTGSGSGGSKGSLRAAAVPGDGLYSRITVNRNPADFCAPGDGNRFMRRGYSE